MKKFLLALAISIIGAISFQATSAQTSPSLDCFDIATAAEAASGLTGDFGFAYFSYVFDVCYDDDFNGSGGGSPGDEVDDPVGPDEDIDSN